VAGGGTAFAQPLEHERPVSLDEPLEDVHTRHVRLHGHVRGVSGHRGQRPVVSVVLQLQLLRLPGRLIVALLVELVLVLLELILLVLVRVLVIRLMVIMVMVRLMEWLPSRAVVSGQVIPAEHLGWVR